MRISVKSYPSSRVFLMALAIPLVLTACAMPRSGAGPVSCNQNCKLVITLPDEASERPVVAENEYRVRGNTSVDFSVGSGNDKARTVLVFEEPAFVDKDDNRIYVLKVVGKTNKYKTVERRACVDRKDCNKYKYTVVNYGTPERPPLDPWIIIE